MCLLLWLVPAIAARPMPAPPADAPSGAATPPQAGSGQPIRAVPASRFAKKVGIVSIHGVIDPMTLQTLERRMDQAAADGCDAVTIELDTPGGDLGATMAICHLLKTHAITNRVAWVRPNAFSAGAITALACREIVVSSVSSLGDAAPIAIGAGQTLQPLPAAERAKLESPVLSEVSDSARRNGYDVRLVRAFIRVDDELWLLERDDGKRLFVDAREYEIAMGSPPDAAHSVEPHLDLPAAVPPPHVDETQVDGAPSEFDAQEAEEEAFVLNSRIAPEETGRWKVLGQVDTRRSLVTLRDDEAVRYGLAKAVINTEQELADFFGAASVVRYDESWSEGLVRFLISWPVRMILIVVMLVSFFVEAITPGVGLFGAIGAIALAVLIGAPALAGLANWWELACILIGLGLIAAELLLLPGYGVAGIAGALLLLVGLVFSFIGGDLGSPQARSDLVIAFFSVLGAFIVSGLCIGFLIRRMPESKLLRRFVLEATVTERPELAYATVAAAAAGDLGVAITDLRPIGRVQFGDAVIEVRSAGGWIAAGRAVRVVATDRRGAIVEEDDGRGEGART